MNTQPQGNPAQAENIPRFWQPLLFLCLMFTAFVLMAVTLPLYSLFFFPAFPNTALQAWLLKLSSLVFSGQALIPAAQMRSEAPGIPFVGSWSETTALLLVFVLLLLVYGLAIRFVAARVSPRFILLSTLLFGSVCVFSPAMTSQDLYSYALYARIGVIYHLNPLTTLPVAVSNDPLYPYIFWIRQPSAYGPSWTLVTSLLQLFVLPLGAGNTLPLLLLLRVLGLLMHCCSAILLWRISNTYKSDLSQGTKLTTLLLFAWNPLLLFEACANAHNDTAVLFLLFLVAWLLLSVRGRTMRYLLVAVLLGVVTGLKITYGLLLPGLLLFLWGQEWSIGERLRQMAAFILAVVGTLFVLYAPFWQQGAVLRVLQVNPGVTRDINSLYQLLIAVVYAVMGKNVPFVSNDVGTPVEILSHQIALLCFVVLYVGISLWYIIHRQYGSTLPALIRWMAISWLLYCLVGSPWFWPWYICPFLGLAILLMSLEGADRLLLKGLPLRSVVFWLTFSMLSMYCFFTWVPHRSTLPFTPLKWDSLTSLWAWVVPLLAITIGRQGTRKGMPLP